MLSEKSTYRRGILIIILDPNDMSARACVVNIILRVVCKMDFLIICFEGCGFSKYTLFSTWGAESDETDDNQEYASNFGNKSKGGLFGRYRKYCLHNMRLGTQGYFESCDYKVCA